ncbi:SAC3/GANP/Nin1/mts3/eIF-3 p25 family isoform X2 [Tasmannia lanceolata]|uniref:SAC3/GANP/Nin1/mts3/eIF-3 p25 family isoform X2 n=1 Tax=Tasmannia lanceolata TaxID=3420 RepID=UPI004063C5D3
MKSQKRLLGLGTRVGSLFDDGGSEVPQRTWSPVLAFDRDHSIEEFHYPSEEAQRPAVSPPRLGNQPKSPVNDAKSLPVHQRVSPAAPHVNGQDTGTRFQTKPASFHAPKRTRSPPLPSPEKVSLGNSHSPLDDTERELQAKAKRLARFNVELSQPLQSPHDFVKKKLPGNKHDHALVDMCPNDNILSDYEGLESSSLIVGLCQDMCPESEREERERKGDLDKFERMDGDRNQTSKSLAVKKYNRTAEREADVIRPMPVLQKTVDYLLGLLDQPYDDKFLGIYNFLWDRMRAIRMDLRMQHIFNRDAITMLEQMIRLHIIAMHELCEYTKGEGFSEGFDAHLNIEQMNKASVDLFQMYYDHRKNGHSILTEKEFRGYYALLKLDKHPGYKVEPAELSLDLAKMTPEIRYTPEILFARDVARACRTGNFIAFFRLARKATYLQACLMHAHFAKLRTQALASLHSGLQNNQGIPVAQVVKWLGMEEEDIESLLEYHGFSIKKFEDAYMVKEGPFLNSDTDYKTKCSQLVHLKKSKRIVDDVSSSQVLTWHSEGRNIVSAKVETSDKKAQRFIENETWVDAPDEEMPEYEDGSTPKDDCQVQPILEGPISTGEEEENESQMAEMFFVPTDNSLSRNSLLAEVRRVGESATDTLNKRPVTLVNTFPEKNLHSQLKGVLPQPATERLSQIETPRGSHSPRIEENSVPQKVIIKRLENEAIVLHQKDEAAAAKLKLILRIWKRQSSKRREFREQHQLAANAALSSLSLGPPLRQNKAQWSHANELNIDHVVRERLDRYGKSWSRLNVSEVVLQILSETNPDARCICWKLIICSQVNDTKGHVSSNHLVGKWLVSKLMGIRKENDDELVISSPGLSIWKKWVISRAGSHRTGCLSIIRDIVFDYNRPIGVDDVVGGASSILFLVSKCIPWELQRTRIHNLILSLPKGSSLPLLIIISGMSKEEIPDPSLTVINKLGLYSIDKSRINSFSVVFLVDDWNLEHTNGFFSDNHLREGLQWLASKSPRQPVLHEVKTRELVLSYLGSSLEMLTNMDISNVGPDHCISAFNEALDRAIEEIVAAADMNCTHWPGPEIDLLEGSSNEYQAVISFLPSICWSSAPRIESTINAIKASKLPCFANDLSWLNRGSDMGKEIQNHKLALENCLIWYLTQESKMMTADLAAREASVMVQKGSGLELVGSNYRIVPRWVMIFRRIYNWRLMNLNSGPFSGAYVLAGRSGHLKHDIIEYDTNAKCLDNSGLERYIPSHYASTGLSLDEMVEVSCRLPFGWSKSTPDPVESPSTIVEEPLSRIVEGGGGALETASDSMEVSGNPSCEAGNSFLSGERNKTTSLTTKGKEVDKLGLLLAEDVVNPRRCSFHENGSISIFGDQSNNSRLVTKEKPADKLSVLLDKCNLLQNKIDEKLVIYF